MNRNVIVVFILAAALCTASVHGSQPTFSTGLNDGTLREMDVLPLSVQATDPDGHALAYAWSITTDETSGKAFFRSEAGTKAGLAVRWISSTAAGQLHGKKITVKVIASHVDTSFPETAESTATYTVSGVNRPPVAAISGRLGTPTDRIPTGYGVCADAYDSSDPDGDGVRGNWSWGSRSGGKWKTPLGDYPPALVGTEGARCCFTVLDMTSNIDQQIVLLLQNGLHEVQATAICYLKPAGSSSTPTNSAPTVTVVNNPVSASVGASAQLQFEAQDLDADTLSYSLVFLQNGSTVANSAIQVSTLSNTKKRYTTTVSTPTAGTFYYRFTVRESNTTDHKTASGTLTLNVGGGGTTDPGNGGPGEFQDTEDTCDITETGGPPSISISPDPSSIKPLFRSGDSVLISVVASDSSLKTWMGQTVRGVASITWGVSELNSLGINPTITPTLARPSDLNTSDSSLSFTVPALTTTRDVFLTVTSKDVLDCGRTVRFAIRLAPGSTSNNQPPVAKIQYKVGSGVYTNAPTTAIPLEATSAITLTLKGDTSTDDGGTANLTYSWAKQDSSITAGGVSLVNTTGVTTTVQITAHTKGTFSVTLTAKDQSNATGVATISFNIIDPALKPIARATVKVGGQALTGPVEGGTVVTLDGSASSRQDNSKTGLTYEWTQTEGPDVTITDADKAVAQITAPAGSENATQLKFKLIVSDAGTPSDPDEVTVQLSSPSFYFSQVAVGPLGSSEFRTVLLLVNRNEQPANGVEVRFFGSDGEPMDVAINGTPWDSAPFNIPALGSRQLVFSGEDLKSGWAKVSSGVPLVGLLQYQIIGQDANLETEVGLFATEAATKFATFYDLNTETAIAVANPTGQPATVNIRLMDDKTGKQVLVKNLFLAKPGSVLPPMNHDAKFLSKEYLGELPFDFSLGTLLIESDVPVSITVLKTRGGVVFSTLPVASTR